MGIALWGKRLQYLSILEARSLSTHSRREGGHLKRLTRSKESCVKEQNLNEYI